MVGTVLHPQDVPLTVQAAQLDEGCWGAGKDSPVLIRSDANHLVLHEAKEQVLARCPTVGTLGCGVTLLLLRGADKAEH